MIALAVVVFGLVCVVAGIALVSVPAAVVAGGLLVAALAALFVDVDKVKGGSRG